MNQAVAVGTASKRSRIVDYEEHQGLIHKLAKKGWARLEAAHVGGVDYEDVFQNMSMSYVRAAEQFNPNMGWSFTAYLGRACLNNFNKWAEKLCSEQCNLGLVRIEDMNAHSDASDSDVYEVFMGEEDSPEDIVSRKQEVLKNLRSLTPNAKRVVWLMMQPSQELLEAFESHHDGLANGNASRTSPTVGFIGRYLDMSSVTIRNVKDELSRKFNIPF
jgi:DNA-directed RNA polymerase specialized sigma24 family protein